MSSLPTPLRAALGVALTVVDTARETATHLPQKAAGLPVAVASQAVQLSLRAQQQYAAYVNKGDELIGAFRGAPEEPPAWATFDEDEPTPARNTAFDRVPDAEDELDELQALDELEGLAEDVAAADTSRIDAALDLLDGSYEAADGPRPTPGAPDTTVETDVTRDPDGDEVIGADAPRTTASREPAREPARKATRKIATKASRKIAAKAPPAAKAAKKAAPPSTAAGATGGLPANPAAKAAAKKAAKKAARKAAPAKKTTPLRAETLPLPASPDSQVSDTQPSDERPDEV